MQYEDLASLFGFIFFRDCKLATSHDGGKYNGSEVGAQSFVTSSQQRFRGASPVDQSGDQTLTGEDLVGDCAPRC